MKLIIDIDDDLYTRLFDNGGSSVTDMKRVCVAVRKGVVIPKGHGRIIDESKITQITYETIEEEFESLLQGTIKHQYVVFKGSDAPTIIEANKTESEG